MVVVCRYNEELSTIKKNAFDAKKSALNAKEAKYKAADQGLQDQVCDA